MPDHLIMQIFLPVPEDLVANARFLDDRRLNKQVLEAYQISRAVLQKCAHPNYPEGTVKGWINHPATLFIFNAGKPKFTWMKQYILTLDAEWQRRGFQRGDGMAERLRLLFEEFQDVPTQSDEGYLSFIGAEAVTCKSAAEASRLYQELLYDKWSRDTFAPRCKTGGEFLNFEL